jgi:hypothetical protein
VQTIRSGIIHVRLCLALVSGAFLVAPVAPAQSPVPRDPFQEKFDAITAEIDREVKAGTIKNDGQTETLRGQLQSIQNFRNLNIDAKGMEFQLRAIQQHAAQISPGLARACNDLLESVQEANREAAARRAQSNAALVQETVQAIRSAKKPADLDAIWATLEKEINVAGNRSIEEIDALSKLREAKNVVETWQRALNDFDKGDLSSASNKVSSLSNRAQSAFGSAIPSSFFDDAAAAWTAYWRSYVESTLAKAKQDLIAAKTPADAMGVNASVTALQKFQSNERGMGPDIPYRIGSAGSISKSWADILRAEENGNYRNALNALESPKGSYHDERSLLTPAEFEAKREALYTAVVQKLKSMLDAAGKQLAAARTPEEIQMIENRFSEYHEVIDRRSNDYADLILKINELRRVAQAWRGVVAAQNNQDSEAMTRGLIELARVNVGADAFIPAAVVEEKRKMAASLAPDTGSGPEATWFASLPNRIGALNKSDDIAALNTEIRTHAGALSGGGPVRDELYHLQSDLGSLTSFAVACEQGRFNFSLVQTMPYEAARHRWQKQTTEVRARFARQALAKQLAAPELMQAPLDLSTLENTVVQLADAAAKNKDWRRVYDLLLACAASDGRLAPGRSHMTDELLGIADFFAGQRFETAQQWPEAVRSYQNVLRRMGDRLPVAEATERLKALKREHPEAEMQAAQVINPARR